MDLTVYCCYCKFNTISMVFFSSRIKPLFYLYLLFSPGQVWLQYIQYIFRSKHHTKQQTFKMQFNRGSCKEKNHWKIQTNKMLSVKIFASFCPLRFHGFHNPLNPLEGETRTWSLSRFCRLCREHGAENVKASF